MAHDLANEIWHGTASNLQFCAHFFYKYGRVEDHFGCRDMMASFLAGHLVSPPRSEQSGYLDFGFAMYSHDEFYNLLDQAMTVVADWIIIGWDPDEIRLDDIADPGVMVELHQDDGLGVVEDDDELTADTVSHDQQEADRAASIIQAQVRAFGLRDPHVDRMMLSAGYGKLFQEIRLRDKADIVQKSEAATEAINRLMVKVTERYVEMVRGYDAVAAEVTDRYVEMAREHNALLNNISHNDPEIDRAASIIQAQVRAFGLQPPRTMQTVLEAGFGMITRWQRELKLGAMRQSKATTEAMGRLEAKVTDRYVDMVNGRKRQPLREPPRKRKAEQLLPEPPRRAALAGAVRAPSKLEMALDPAVANTPTSASFPETLAQRAGVGTELRTRCLGYFNTPRTC